MTKQLIITILLFISFGCLGQGKITDKKVIVTQYGHTKWAIQYLPDSFNLNTKKYPIIVFFHGVGETGRTEGDLVKLFSQGPFPYATIVGKDFILLAIQDESFSPIGEQVYYVLKNDYELKDRISNVFYTGLSAGAQMLMGAVCTNQEMASFVTGVVPMSSPGYSKDGIQYAINAKVKVWGFCGYSDNVAPASVMIDFVNKLGGIFTPKPDIHGGWQTYYDPKYRESGKNIYEWMLSFVTPITPPTDAKPKIILYEDGTWKAVN